MIATHQAGKLLLLYNYKLVQYIPIPESYNRSKRRNNFNASNIYIYNILISYSKTNKNNKIYKQLIIFQNFILYLVALHYIVLKKKNKNNNENVKLLL